jgi:probable FeS assembly SUF system protein SufT
MINPTHIDEQVTLARDVEAITIPFGSKTILKKGEVGQITQALGSSYTVMIGGNLFRIDGKDADSIGKEALEELDKSHEKENGHLNEQAVWDAMKTCYDPEIPVNIVDLGLIYSCEFNIMDNNSTLVEIKMTLTAPGCGMGPVIADEVKQKVNGVPGVGDVKLELVWDPPWDQSMISEAARLQMGLL